MKQYRCLKIEDRNFILFLTGRTFSVLISSIYTFAIGLFVLKMTGSSMSFAITLSLQILPTVLLGPFAGVMADKLNKKVISIAADAFNAIILIGMFLISNEGISLSLVYTTTLMISISQTLYCISIDSAIPGIFSKKNIVNVNSISKVVDSAAAIISPGIGGFLYSIVDLRLFILVNAITFVFLAIIEGFINFSLHSEAGNFYNKLNIKDSLIEGFRYIRETRNIKFSIINFSILNFFMSLLYAIPIPFILNSIFNLSSNNYGIVQGFVPAGMIIGALIVKRLSDVITYDRLIYVAGLLFSLCMFLLGILPAIASDVTSFIVVPYYGFVLLFFGFIISLLDIPFINHFQLNVPGNIRGRTLSISLSIIKAINPLGYILSGFLAGYISAFTLPLFGSAAILITCFLINKCFLTSPIDTTRSKG